MPDGIFVYTCTKSIRLLTKSRFNFGAAKNKKSHFGPYFGPVFFFDKFNKIDRPNCVR